ncbi:MAG TPA: tRNA (adenosine(37)-N6)-threonylcarbamoyltransferase complex dimerization subunit type 1 TsaB [Zeimonas sp.]|nr:tRNA (adenosine(37)-N6)-threonylcarbamoyltransferase complex dimerization subunit type 1 TsaB [Zeimonas sp.]
MDSSSEADSPALAPRPRSRPHAPGSRSHAQAAQHEPNSAAQRVRPVRVLALSTSGTWCSVALYRHGFGDDDSDCISEPLGAQQSMNILAMVDELCRGARIELAELDAIAFDAGPGSFTGLRIGCAVAQGLGFALDRPLVAVDSLRALAWQRVRFGTAEAIVLAANDARMDELYVAMYRIGPVPGEASGANAAALLETLEAPRIVARARFVDEIDEWLRTHRPLAGADALLRAGDAWVHAPTALAWDARFGTIGPPAPVADDAYVRADALAELGCADWHAGRAIPASQAAPRYLRDKVALDHDEQRAARERAEADSRE